MPGLQLGPVRIGLRHQQRRPNRVLHHQPRDFHLVNYSLLGQHRCVPSLQHALQKHVQGSVSRSRYTAHQVTARVSFRHLFGLPPPLLA